jgi:uncharacterized protein involved in exopolysaccharide biosynthesis
VSTQTETSTKTYSELIKSRPVIERVVRALGLDQPEEVVESSALTARLRPLKDGIKEFVGESWQILKYGRILASSPFDEAASKLSAGIAVSPTRNSYVFAIDTVWPQPELAAAIANQTAQAFVDLLSEISKGEAEGARRFIERRWQESKTELDQARQALREFKEQHHSVAFDEETVQEIRLIAKLEAAFETAQSRLSGLRDQFTAENPKVLNVQAQRNQLAKSITERRRDLLDRPEKEARLALLQLNVSTAEQLFEMLAREYEDARIREAKRTSDIRVVAPALVPVQPIKPIKIYYAAVAFLLALMVGVGLAFALEVSNTRLRDIDAVQLALGVPVLATLPDVVALRDPRQ